MKIQVFGSGGGCAPCKTMLRNAETAVAELGLSTEVEYVTRIQHMLELGISGSPALVVDGEVKCVGKALDVTAIKAILTEVSK
jgi:small redox-active disulfide protein 2